MVELTYLVSTFLMSLFLLAILVVVARVRGTGRTATASEGQRTVSELPNIDRNVPARPSDAVSSETPMGWVVGFLLLVLAAGAGAIVFMGETSLSTIGISAQMAGLALVIIIGGLVCGYFVSGIYLSLRSHGRKPAEATGVALWLLGLLGVVVIVVNLVFGSS